jgi:hypothetical protein
MTTEQASTEPIHCPRCTSTDIQKGWQLNNLNRTGFLEVGEYDGHVYEHEEEICLYKCLKCYTHFAVG